MKATHLKFLALAIVIGSALFRNVSAASGTGFMVSPGLIVTNEHVISQCRAIEVLSSRNRMPASILDVDATADLALLSVQGLPSDVAKLRTDSSLDLGEQVMVFGFPLAGALSSAGNFTIGNVSGLMGLNDAAGQIQITAPVQPGNSGGPILDDKGQLVGVVRSKLDALRAASHIGDIPQNVNFGISLPVLLEFLKKNNVRYTPGQMESKKSAVEVAKVAQSFTYLIRCAGGETPKLTKPAAEPVDRLRPPSVRVPKGQSIDSGKNNFAKNVRTVDRLFQSIPSYSIAINGTSIESENIVTFSDGLPKEFYDSLASTIRLKLAERVTAYEKNQVKYGGSLDDMSVGVTSGVAALVDGRIDAVFVEFSDPNFCGAGGCTTYVFRQVGDRWYEVGSLFGCTRVTILQSKSNGLRNIQYTACRSSPNIYIYKYDGNGYVNN